MIKKLIIFCTLTVITPNVLADGLCPGGEFNPVDNKCYPIQNRGNGGNGSQTAKVDLWGAIAADTNGTKASSIINARTEENAENGALKQCGLSSCKLLVVFKNSCGATAGNEDIYAAGGIGNTPAQA